MVLVQSPVELLLFSAGSWCVHGFVVPSKTGVSVSPSPVEVLESNPADFQGQIPWGFPDPLLGPQAGKPDMGFQTFTTVGELV